MKRPALGILCAATALTASDANAAFHLMMITEVFAGSTAQPGAFFVELTMYSAGQNFVAGHSVVVYDAQNNVLSTHTFPGNVAGGNNQAKILVGSSQAATLFNVPMDLVATGSIPLEGGKVCFDTIDCVAWGSYAGPTAGVGSAFAPAVGLTPGKSIHRKLDTIAPPTTLEPGDDTGDSANDFVLGVPSPINNAGTVGTVPPSTCGNSSTEGLESCDDGNAINTDACKNDCTAPVCGDNVTSAGEACDDGNLVQTDACLSSCVAASCGDGFTQTGVEECDDDNAVNTDACKNDCTLPFCGDNVVSPGEMCDDGNTIDGDGCESDCTLDTCGNGAPDAGEECDDGNDVDGDGCTATCLVEECGDGTVNNNGTEACDDGNQVDDDECKNDCTLPVCGDSLVSTGEECDDGNQVNEDECRNDCTLPFCGDGITDAGEECDDANDDELDGCLTGCIAATCGDSVVNQPTEQCDDGNLDDEDGCSNQCIAQEPAACGDGSVDPGEGCDDGNVTDGDGCSATCSIEAACGDGVVDAGEGCDDGNDVPGDGCSASCNAETTFGDDNVTTPAEDDGCGCRVPGADGPERSGWGWWLVAAAGAALARIRRGRSPRPR